MQREVRSAPEVVSMAIVDGINHFVRTVLIPRCPDLERILEGPEDAEILRLKNQMAATFAARWAICHVIDAT